MMIGKACVLVLFLSAAVFSLPLTDESKISLVEYVEEHSNGAEHTNTVAGIEATTEDEVKALKSEAQHGVSNGRVLPDVQAAEDQAKQVANTANKLEQSRWYVRAGVLPTLQTVGSNLADELKAANIEGKKLVKLKQMSVKEEIADQKVINDLQHTKTQLGEAGITDDARLKAAKWKEGQTLAKLADKLGKGESKISNLDKQMIQEEKSALKEAQSNAELTDDAGFALNAWYNKYEHGNKKKELFHATALGESQSHSDHFLQQGNAKGLSPEQQQIERTAISTIKQVQERAAAAIEKLSGGTTQSSVAHSGSTRIHGPSRMDSSSLLKPKATNIQDFNKMADKIHEDVAKVAGEALSDQQMQEHEHRQMQAQRH
jgi:hypothetical protein